MRADIPALRDGALFMQIAGSRVPFPGAAEASAIYRATIERYDRETGRGGASGFPACQIVTDAGEVVAHVSYNGRVWAGRDWQGGAEPLYCPAARAPAASSLAGIGGQS